MIKLLSHKNRKDHLTSQPGIPSSIEGEYNEVFKPTTRKIRIFLVYVFFSPNEESKLK